MNKIEHDCLIFVRLFFVKKKSKENTLNLWTRLIVLLLPNSLIISMFRTISHKL